MRSAEKDMKICEEMGELLERVAASESVMTAEDAELIAVVKEALSWWIRRVGELEQQNREMRVRLSRLTLETE